jgi:hypothetical protein
MTGLPRFWELGGRAGDFDRMARVAKEYWRSSIGDARAPRIRAASAGVESQTDFDQIGLRTLAHRTLLAGAFPAVILVLYLLPHGAPWRLRS